MSISLGVDVGGTFTDFIEVDSVGSTRVVKSPTTPRQPAEGVINGLVKLAGSNESLNAYLSNIDLIVHGTTITTNAVITRNYAKTGYITTKGFRNILNSRRGMKRSAFTAKESPPEPIVPEYLVQTIAERVDKDGKIIVALNEGDVVKSAEFFSRHEVEAIAVNLMFSFKNPSHEVRVKEIIEQHLPGVYLCLSHKVLPQVRMYERGSTTVFNACVGPLLKKYIDDLQLRLRKSGFTGKLLTMQSNGGVISPEGVKDFGANTLLSGPASGPGAALYFSRPHGLDDLITIDMGGTSLDACLVRNGRPAITNQSEVAEYALGVSSLDIRAIGAGGGSLAKVDNAGLLSVGPESAGADPGPICYGLGGKVPTVTDANLVLGYINPDYFLGGERKLDLNLASKQIKKQIAQPLKVTTTKAAEGIIQLVNAKMANGVRQVSIERGFDPRDAMLVIAGGAGSLHGCGIAKELGLELVMVPKASSVLCATGMLTTDLRHDLVQYAEIQLNGRADIRQNLDTVRKELIERGKNLLRNEGIETSKHHFEFTADMMFEGQFNILETYLPALSKNIGKKLTSADLDLIQEDFRNHHRAVYGYALDDAVIEIQSLRLSAVGQVNPPKFERIGKGKKSPSKAKKDSRIVWFNGRRSKVDVFEGEALKSGNFIGGPAIVEQPTTTVLINPGWNMQVDNYGSFILWSKNVGLTNTLDRLSRGRVKSISELIR